MLKRLYVDFDGTMQPDQAGAVNELDFFSCPFDEKLLDRLYRNTNFEGGVTIVSNGYVPSYVYQAFYPLHAAIKKSLEEANGKPKDLQDSQKRAVKKAFLEALTKLEIEEVDEKGKSRKVSITPLQIQQLLTKNGLVSAENEIDLSNLDSVADLIDYNKLLAFYSSMGKFIDIMESGPHYLMVDKNMKDGEVEGGRSPIDQAPPTFFKDGKATQRSEEFLTNFNYFHSETPFVIGDLKMDGLLAQHLSTDSRPVIAVTVYNPAAQKASATTPPWFGTLRMHRSATSLERHPIPYAVFEAFSHLGFHEQYFKLLALQEQLTEQLRTQKGYIFPDSSGKTPLACMEVVDGFVAKNYSKLLKSQSAEAMSGSVEEEDDGKTKSDTVDKAPIYDRIDFEELAKRKPTDQIQYLEFLRGIVEFEKQTLMDQAPSVTEKLAVSDKITPVLGKIDQAIKAAELAESERVQGLIEEAERQIDTDLFSDETNKRIEKYGQEIEYLAKKIEREGLDPDSLPCKKKLYLETLYKLEKDRLALKSRLVAGGELSKEDASVKVALDNKEAMSQLEVEIFHVEKEIYSLEAALALYELHSSLYSQKLIDLADRMFLSRQEANDLEQASLENLTPAEKELWASLLESPEKKALSFSNAYELMRSHPRFEGDTPNEDYLEELEVQLLEREMLVAKAKFGPHSKQYSDFLKKDVFEAGVRPFSACLYTDYTAAKIAAIVYGNAFEPEKFQRVSGIIGKNQALTELSKQHPDLAKAVLYQLREQVQQSSGDTEFSSNLEQNLKQMIKVALFEEIIEQAKAVWDSEPEAPPYAVDLDRNDEFDRLLSQKEEELKQGKAIEDEFAELLHEIDSAELVDFPKPPKLDKPLLEYAVTTLGIEEIFDPTVQQELVEAHTLFEAKNLAKGHLSHGSGSCVLRPWTEPFEGRF